MIAQVVIGNPMPNPVIILLLDLFFIVLAAYFLYMITRLFFRTRPNKVLLSYLRRSSQLANQINTWIEDHIEELKADPIKTLNNPELLDLVERAQQVDDIIREIDPVYKDKFIPSKELHRHMIEIAQGRHKQTH